MKVPSKAELKDEIMKLRAQLEIVRQGNPGNGTTPLPLNASTKSVTRNDLGSSKTPPAPFSTAPSTSAGKKFTGVKSTKQLGVAWQRITREFNLTHVSDFKEVLSKGQLQTKHDHLKAEYAAIRSQLEKETGSRSGIDGDDGEQREPRCASRQRYSRENLPDYWETLVEYFWVVKGAPIFDDGRSEAADDSMEYIENSPVVSDSDSAPASPVLPKRRRSEEIERKIKKQRKQYREMKRLEEEELTQALTDMFNGFSKGLFALAAGIAARNNCA